MVTAEQRARIEELKAERAKLKTPAERIAFDNAANSQPGDEMVLRLIAAMEPR